MTERPDERSLNAMFRVGTGACAHNPITVATRPQLKPEIIMRTTNLITATALAAALAGRASGQALSLYASDLQDSRFYGRS